MTNPTEAPMANAIDDVKEWRCEKCDCTMFARIEKITEVQDGRVHSEPGQYVRCVECKDISFHPLPASQHTGWSDEAVEAAANGLYEEDDAWSAALPWPKLAEPAKLAYRRLARAALTAVSSIAPATGFEVMMDKATALERSLEVEGSGVNAYLRDDIESLISSIRSSISPSVAKESGEWQGIETAPKNRKILAAYRNELGNWRVVTACYHTQLPWSDDHWRDDDDESEYAPEGWYEESDSSETIYQTSSRPTHWQPLPTPPEAKS